MNVLATQPLPFQELVAKKFYIVWTQIALDSLNVFFPKIQKVNGVSLYSSPIVLLFFPLRKGWQNNYQTFSIPFSGTCEWGNSDTCQNYYKAGAQLTNWNSDVQGSVWNLGHLAPGWADSAHNYLEPDPKSFQTRVKGGFHDSNDPGYLQMDECTPEGRAAFDCREFIRKISDTYGHGI